MNNKENTTREEEYQELLRKYSNKEYSLYIKGMEEQELRGKIKELTDHQARGFMAKTHMINVKVPADFIIQVSIDDIKRAVLGLDDTENIINGYDKLQACEEALAHAHTAWSMYERLYYNTKHEAERWRLTPKQEELEKRLRTADLEIERLYRENHELKEQVKKHAPAISDLDKAIIN